MKKRNIENYWKVVVAIAVALAFVMPGAAAFANVGAIGVTSNSETTGDMEDMVEISTNSDTSDNTENTVLVVTDKDNSDNLDNIDTLSTIYVDDDADPSWYDATHVKTITEGITNATAGDTVYVYNGTYYEKVTVNKQVGLVGESRENVIVDGSGSGNVVKVTVSDVSVDTFTMTNGSYGIYISKVPDINIVNCDVHDVSSYGIYATECPGTSIENCNVYNNNRGFYLYKASDVTVKECDSYSNSDSGVYLYSSPSNTVTNCEIYDNSNYGFYIRNSKDTNLTGNIINNNVFYIRATSILDFYHDIDTSNTIDGNPIYYIVGEDDYTIDGVTVGYLGFISCNRATAENIDTSGVLLVDTTDAMLSNISSHSAEDGIYVYQSPNTEIIDCKSYGNKAYGIYLSESPNGDLENNEIYDNSGYGFRVAGVDIIHFNQTIDTSNTIDGNPIYYIVGEDDYTIDGVTVGYLGFISCNRATAENIDTSGVLLVDTTNSTISDSHSHSAYAGIYALSSSNNEIINCNFYTNYYGIYLSESSDNDVIDCDSYSNSYRGCYFISSSNNRFENYNSYGNSGMTMYLKSSDGNYFINCDFHDDDRGPYLSSGKGVNFVNCDFYNMKYMLYTDSGISYVNVTNCNFYDGISQGIKLAGGHHNVVDCNVYNIDGDGSYFYMTDSVVANSAFYSNTNRGIYLFYAENSEIVNCSSFNNAYGIYCTGSDNVIHHNNFIDNVQNAYDKGANQWDDNSSEGNYWSDYTGVDADGDGIGDTPYTIPGGSNQDRYPLMDPILVAPVLLLPPDGSSTPDKTPTFDWTDVVSANYELQVSTDPGFIALVIDQINISDSEYTPTTDLLCDTYYWRVKAIGGSWSTVSTFSIISNEKPATPDRPSGTNEGKTGIEYTFSSSTTDPDDDQVYYKFSWGDDTESIWLGPYDSGETVESSHTWTEEGYYAVKVKAKDIYDAESDWSDSLIVHITIPIPDLDCDGGLSWTDVEPGSTVTGEFTVKNIGDPTSLLDWEIAEWPSWGTWTFTPSSGNDLTPEDGAITVTVSVVAPDEENKEFSGEVKIVNTEDSSDFEIISVSLATPVNQNSANAISTVMNRTDAFPSA